MKKQAVKSVASFAVMLMFLSIIPSGAFALENGTSVYQVNEKESGKMMPGGMRHGGAGPDEMRDMGFGPAENITEENFTEIQTEMLDSITEKIAELQSMYSNVSEASTAEELQAVLLAERQANAEGAASGEKNGFRGEMCGLCLFEARDVTEENFTDVQTEMLNSLQNMTENLEETQVKLTEAGKEDRAEELDEKIAELQNLYSELGEASTAAELKEIIFSYLQTQAVTSLEKEIEFLNARITEDENATDEQFEERIIELTALIADLEDAESLDELKEIMSSDMKDAKGPMQQGGRRNIPGRPDSMQVNSTEENSTEV
ncbi:hypothetical protein [Methanosarcina sp. DH2]|uniref:hypothetical protein n=1 Tax=Methanosarcina sp. DH2 TaxID=2605639 RepID=UPI001E3A3703|nr:hypothetical protein [Methanosarcina sp. DH2]